MEERVPPATADDHHHNNKGEQEEEFDDYYNIDDNKQHVARKEKDNNNNNNNTNDNNNDHQTQIIPSNQRPHATYIIQVPKDQIYRVPPPENAEIVERYRNPVQENQQGRRRCLYWFLSVFFVAAFLISVIVCVHHFTLKPKNPTFSIKHLSVKQPASSSKNKNNNAPGFQVTLVTTNPNSVNDIGYAQGNATLAYKGKEIGRGSFPALANEASGKSDSVDLLLKGSSKTSLPKELQSQPQKGRKKQSVNLNLSMNIPLKLKTWLFQKRIKIKVGCNFEVDSMGENIKVQSQKCDIQK